MIYIPKGALILSQGNSSLGKLIRWGQRSWREAPSRVNHSLLTIQGGVWPPNGWFAAPIIAESDAVVRTGSLAKLHASDKLVIWDIDMTERERNIVARDVERHRGRPYAVLQLFGQLIDNKLLFGANVFRRLAKYDPLDICSHLTGDAFQKVDISFGEPGYAQSPDDQDDYLREALAWGYLVDNRLQKRRVRLLWDDLA